MENSSAISLGWGLGVGWGAQKPTVLSVLRPGHTNLTQTQPKGGFGNILGFIFLLNEQLRVFFQQFLWLFL